MSLDAAIDALVRGLVIGVPTDTVYGLAVDPHSASAVESVFALKGRARGAPLPVLAVSVDQIVRDLGVAVQALDGPAGCWPGPLTAVVTTPARLPWGVGDADRGTVAVRVPGHPVLAEILAIYGPLAVTSANRSGEPPSLSSGEARSIFGDSVAVYVDGQPGAARPSTIVDFTREPARLLRQGPQEWPPGSGARQEAQ